jgi:LysM repeat protein
MPSSNPGGYTGNTGIIQYATGNGSSPSVVNIGHVQDITAGGTIFTTGHLAATPATNIVPLSIIGSTGGTADLVDVYTGGSALKAFYVDYLGGTNVGGNLNVTSTAALMNVYGQSMFGRGMQSIMSYGDEVPLRGYGYAGGTADLLELFNQSGGAEGFHVTHWGSLSITPTADTVSAQEIYGYPGGTGNLLAAYNDSIGLGGTNVFKIGHSGNTSIAAASDVVGLTVTGYTGGTADLLDVYNQTSGNFLYRFRRLGLYNYANYTITTSIADPTSFSMQYAAAGTGQLTLKASGGTGNESDFLVAANSGGFPTVTLVNYLTTYTGVSGTGVCTRYQSGFCVSF